ncbi:MAG: aminofutalosine synthase MqnE [Thermodesulfobacterium geofontis]|uniref:Aminofutalosine synthase MqnE n=1 Tax=Thermodesulfobacterium geofontis TaxID=1295609 RepID=A0A2N7QBW6_9BACT|nr:MAG: aminofutalosine synthase MqnE [Thermodesulfobacterium geofontis]
MLVIENFSTLKEDKSLILEEAFKKNRNLEKIAEKVLNLEPLDFDSALRLYNEGDLFFLGELANKVKEKIHGKNYYYTINRHINYTNICAIDCKFCGYHKRPGEEGGYTLKIDEILEKLKATPGLREVHIVGGLNPKLPYEYYIELVRRIRSAFPEIHIRAYTCVEIDWLSRISGKSVEEVLKELKSAGLNSIPGGGAEVFSERIRAELYPAKISSERWIEIAKTAHKLGIPTNATLLFGHIETDEEIIKHLFKLREIQENTKGFYCFIPLAFIPENNKLSYLPGPSAEKILKTIAISRIILNNFPHIKAYWVFLGIGLSQVALLWGADHFHGTVIEEKISEAMRGEPVVKLPPYEIEKLIREIGGEPVLV